MKKSIAGIIVRDGLFLIGKRLPVGEMGGKWEFPGGKVDPGETSPQTIIREFSEEMNITVKPVECLTRVQFTNKNGPVELEAWLISLSGVIHPTLTEHSEIRWASLDEIERLDFVDSDQLLLPFLRGWKGGC